MIRISFSLTAKNIENKINDIDIFADNVIYYIVDWSNILIRFMTEEIICDIFQLLK